MNDRIKSEIETYCYLIGKGKPSAMLPIQTRYTETAKEIIHAHKLSHYIEDLADGWKVLWIYKDKYLIDIIKKMPEKPNTVYDHWVLGKIFGYSDEAIREFIEVKLYKTQCGCT